MYWTVSHGSKKENKVIEIEKFTTHTPGGPCGEVKAGCRRERAQQDMGTCLCWNSQAPTRLVKSNPKEWGFDELHGGLM